MSRGGHASRHGRQTGFAYLVGAPFWMSVPSTIRTAAASEFRRCFAFGKRQLMELKAVNASQIPARLPFTDNIVRVGADSAVALQILQKVVSRQVARVPGLTLKTPPGWNDRMEHGRSYCFKAERSVSMWNSPVCISESAISFRHCLAYWRRMTFTQRRKKVLTMPITEAIGKSSTVTWTQSCQRDWQDWFGRFIGRVMAHETYHTIRAYDPKTGTAWAPHLGTGKLEASGGGASPYRSESTVGFSSEAQYRMLTQFKALSEMQKRCESYPIERGSPSMLEINLAKDRTETAKWEKKLKEYLESV